MKTEQWLRKELEDSNYNIEVLKRSKSERRKEMDLLRKKKINCIFTTEDLLNDSDLLQSRKSPPIMWFSLTDEVRDALRFLKV